MSNIKKSSKNRIIGGVCGGLAEAMGISPTILRIVTVLFVPFAGISVLVYLVLCLVLPAEDKEDKASPKYISNAGSFCPHCGKELPSNAVVCPYCGAKR